VLGGCVDSGAVIKLPADGARSLILASFENGVLQRLDAEDVGKEAYFSLPYHSDADLVVYEIAFPCTLSALGLASGSFTPDPSGHALPLGLAESVREFHVPPRADPNAAQPTNTSSAPADLESIKISAGLGLPDPCVTFSVEPHQLPVPEMFNFAVPLMVGIGGDRALLASWNGQFFIVSPGQTRALTTVSTTTARLGGWLAPTGELWLAGIASMDHGPPEGPFVPGPARTGTAGPVRLIGPTTSTVPFEMFAADATMIEHYTPDRGWTTLMQRAHPVVGAVDPVSMVWVGPDEMWVTGFRDLVTIQHYKNGVVSESFLPDGDHARTLGVTPIGLVVRSENGDLTYRWDGSRWEPLHATVSLNRVQSIIGFRGGFLMGGDFGNITQYVPQRSGSFCPITPYASSGISTLIPLEHRVLLVESGAASSSILTPIVQGSVATCSP
jgi:hypothetical protein